MRLLRRPRRDDPYLLVFPPVILLEPGVVDVSGLPLDNPTELALGQVDVFGLPLQLERVLPSGVVDVQGLALTLDAEFLPTGVVDVQGLELELVDISPPDLGAPVEIETCDLSLSAFLDSDGDEIVVAGSASSVAISARSLDEKNQILPVPATAQVFVEWRDSTGALVTRNATVLDAERTMVGYTFVPGDLAGVLNFVSLRFYIVSGGFRRYVNDLFVRVPRG